MSHEDCGDSASDHGTLDPMLAQYLSNRNVPCPSCTYNLRSVKVNRCPECGHPLTLLDSRPVYTTPYLVGFGALCGLVAVVAWYVVSAVHILAIWGNRPLPPDWIWHQVVSNGCMLVITVSMLIAWILLRKWTLKQGAPAQWFFAVVCITMYLLLYLTDRFLLWN